MAASFRVIIRNTSLDFEWKVAEILVKKRGISNQPDVCIFDDPCLSKFGALRECSNVEETRNLMQTSDRKECSHFFQKNFLLPFTQNRVVCFLLLSVRRGGNRYNSAGREDLLAKDTGTVWSGIIS